MNGLQNFLRIVFICNSVPSKKIVSICFPLPPPAPHPSHQFNTIFLRPCLMFSLIVSLQFLNPNEFPVCQEPFLPPFPSKASWLVRLDVFTIPRGVLTKASVMSSQPFPTNVRSAQHIYAYNTSCLQIYYFLLFSYCHTWI